MCRCKKSRLISHIRFALDLDSQDVRIYRGIVRSLELHKGLAHLHMGLILVDMVNAQSTIYLSVYAGVRETGSTRRPLPGCINMSLKSAHFRTILNDGEVDTGSGAIKPESTVTELTPSDSELPASQRKEHPALSLIPTSGSPLCTQKWLDVVLSPPLPVGAIIHPTGETAGSTKPAAFSLVNLSGTLPSAVTQQAAATTRLEQQGPQFTLNRDQQKGYACDRCRVMKRRCDRGMPCMLCERQDRECSYRQGTSATARSFWTSGGQGATYASTVEQWKSEEPMIRGDVGAHRA